MQPNKNELESQLSNINLPIIQQRFSWSKLLLPNKKNLKIETYKSK